MFDICETRAFPEPAVLPSLELRLKILHNGEWFIRLVKHSKYIRRSPAKLLSARLDRHTGTCWASNRVLSPQVRKILVILAYEERLSGGLVLRLRRHRIGETVKDAIEGGNDLALRAEQPTSTIPPTTAVMSILAAPVDKRAFLPRALVFGTSIRPSAEARRLERDILEDRLGSKKYPNSLPT